MRRNPAVLFVASAAVAIAVAGCGGSDSGSKGSSSTKKQPSIAAQSRTVVGGNATFIANPATSAALKQAGVSASAARDTAVKGSSVIMPLKSGTIVVASMIGSVRSPGSIVYKAAGKQVVFANVVVNTRLRRVSGKLNGKERVGVYQVSVNNLKQSRVKANTVMGTGLSLTLTKKAAAALNGGLGVKVFKKGMKMGTLTLTVVTRKSSPQSDSSKSSK